MRSSCITDVRRRVACMYRGVVCAGAHGDRVISGWVLGTTVSYHNNNSTIVELRLVNIHYM